MRKIISAAIAGNALEIYDIIIYGFFAPVIAIHFFPKEDKLASIASTFAVFFIGYLARPIGALFFGRMGDRLGRKPSLLLSVWLIAVSAFSIGLLPDQQAIGVWAPILLTLLRLLQGFSVGGELIGSVIFVLEHAPKTKRGFYGSLAVAGFSLGLLLASFVSWSINTLFTHDDVVNWAWRLPFLLAGLGGFVGWWLRRGVPETELFYETYRLPTSYFETRRDLLKQLRYIPSIIGIELFGAVLSYLMYIFLITYMTISLHYTMHQAMSINLISVILLVLLQPLMGKISDRVGRRPLLTLGLIGNILWVWPTFLLLQQNNLVLALLALIIMSLFGSAYFGIDVVTMVEIVPVQIRFSVVAFAYAIAVSLFGGITPLAATLLLKKTGSYVSLVLLVSVCALISLFTVYKLRETKPKTIKQSTKEDIRKIARNMLANGDSVEKVAAVTALSKDEVADMQG